MFVHLRHLSALSFIVVLVVSLFMGGYFRIIASEGVVQGTTEQHSVALAQFFIKNVWEHNKALMEKLSSQEVSVWQKNAQFKTFSSEVARYAQDMPVVALRLYTGKGQVFFSSNNLQTQPTPHHFLSFAALSEKIFSSSGKNQGLEAARSGKVHSRIIPSMEITSPGGEGKNIAVIQTFIPIKSNATNVEAEVEILTDISEIWRYLFYLQVISTLGIMCIFSVLYSALFYSFAKAQALLHRQHQTIIGQGGGKEHPLSERTKISKLLARIERELYAPLNAIIGVSALIVSEAGAIKNAATKEHLQGMHSASKALLYRMITLLDDAKAENGDLVLNNIRVDMTKLLKASLQEVVLDAERASLHVASEIPDTPLWIDIDAKRLKQVLRQLFANAIGFTPPHGTITLSAWVDVATGIIAIEVRNTGVPIALPPSHSHEHTGLGLPLTRKLVRLMGGGVAIQGDVGVGTSVIITLPYIPIVTP